MTNTKIRHQQIYSTAVQAVKNAGGVETIDALSPAARKPQLKIMAHYVVNQTDCQLDTARRNVAKAMHRAQEDNWGGNRPNQPGRPPLPEGKKRQRVSTRLAPGVKELAQAIARKQELPGWGWVLDELVRREATRLGITM